MSDLGTASRRPKHATEETAPEKGAVSSALLEAVLETSRTLVAVAARSLGTQGQDVTLPQFRALVVLATYGPVRLSDLANALMVEPPTATRLCDRLVRKGLILRSQSPSDRRELHIELSDEGRRFLAVVNEHRRSEISQILGTLPQRKQAALLAAFGEFARTAREFNATHGPARFEF